MLIIPLSETAPVNLNVVKLGLISSPIFQAGLILAKVIPVDLSSYSLWMAMLLKHDRLVSSRGEEAALFLPFLVCFRFRILSIN